MKHEDRSKIQDFINEVEGLKFRAAIEESKFKDWKEKVEKKLDEAFGKNSDQYRRFQRTKFFKFDRGGKPKTTPLSEQERREYFQGLDDAKRILRSIT